MVYLELALLAVAAIGIYFGYRYAARGLQIRRQNAAVRSTDAVEPGDCRDGEAAVEGTVVADDPLPIGDGECVAAELEVFQRGLGEDNTFLVGPDGEESVPFSIRDGDEAIRIDAAEVTVEASAERTFEAEVDADEEQPERAARVDRWADLGLQPSGGSREYDLSWIEAGDEVYAYGSVERRDGVQVLADGGGAFFVTDEDPDRLLENRRHSFKTSLAKGVGSAVVGVGALLVGVVFLLA